MSCCGLLFMLDGERRVPFADITGRVDADALERRILTYWEEQRIFARSLDQRRRRERFTFYDGPPYATGKPHYGHVLQSAIKDTVLRYQTMRGYFVPRRVGWDCHGLPVEVLVERELKLKTKREVERIGIAAFNTACRETVFRYIDEFTATLKRLGRWADYEHAYTTLTREYMESEWWVFKQLWEAGLVYKDYRSTPYCIRCATPLSNFEVSMAYREKTDTAVYVALRANVKRKAESGKHNGLYLLIWTTTPWTLPGNVAVAVSPTLSYVSVEHEGRQFVVARERVAAVFGGQAQAGRTWSAEELVQLIYERPYHPKPGVVVQSEHVTADEGTGLVHIAPAFGEEDAELGKKHGWSTLRPIDVEGRFTAEVPQWAGEPIFSVQSDIVADLQQRGLLVRAEPHTHSYPFCWRCDEPLIYYALDTWFVKISAFKDRMLLRNEDINWIPKHVQHGRFGTGIESAPDWAVSRNRFWSVPLPVWECAGCGERVCVGSVAELQALSGAGDIPDLHRPYVDEISWSCERCHGRMLRVSEVLDVWFDAGSMPYAQWHYPFENEEVFQESFPADFIVEAIEQTRSWFYVMHVLAVALRDSVAYRSVIASGLIFGEDGQKLSKKLKNYPELLPTLKEFGADVLRFYLMSSTSLGEPYRLSRADLQQVYRSVYLTLWNVYSFFTRYAHVRGWRAPAPGEGGGSVLDRWILARLKQLQCEVTAHADAFEVDVAARAFIPFISDLSNWYVRRSRGRFQPAKSRHERDRGPSPSDSSAEGAFATLYTVLVETAKLLAPFMPFVTEEIFRTLTGRESVHLEDLLDPAELTGDERHLLEEMVRAREIVSEALALRAAAHIKIRQPLHELVVAGETLVGAVAALVADEVNVKAVRFAAVLPLDSAPASAEATADKAAGGQGKLSRAWAQSAAGGKVRVALHVEPSAALQREGVARDIIRRGQALRAKAGLALDERITLVLRADADELTETLAEQGAAIQAALQADEVVREACEAAGADVRLAGGTLHVGIAKKETAA